MFGLFVMENWPRGGPQDVAAALVQVLTRIEWITYVSAHFVVLYCLSFGVVVVVLGLVLHCSLHVLSEIMLDWSAAQGFPGWPPETGSLGVKHDSSFILLESSSLVFFISSVSRNLDQTVVLTKYSFI